MSSNSDSRYAELIEQVKSAIAEDTGRQAMERGRGAEARILDGSEYTYEHYKHRFGEEWEKKLAEARAPQVIEQAQVVAKKEIAIDEWHRTEAQSRRYAEEREIRDTANRAKEDALRTIREQMSAEERRNAENRPDNDGYRERQAEELSRSMREQSEIRQRLENEQVQREAELRERPDNDRYRERQAEELSRSMREQSEIRQRLENEQVRREIEKRNEEEMRFQKEEAQRISIERRCSDAGGTVTNGSFARESERMAERERINSERQAREAMSLERKARLDALSSRIRESYENDLRERNNERRMFLEREAYSRTEREANERRNESRSGFYSLGDRREGGTMDRGDSYSYEREERERREREDRERREYERREYERREYERREFENRQAEYSRRNGY